MATRDGPGIRRAEPEGFLVADVEGKVTGYVIWPTDAGRIRGPWEVMVLELVDTGG